MSHIMLTKGREVRTVETANSNWSRSLGEVKLLMRVLPGTRLECKARHSATSSTGREP